MDIVSLMMKMRVLGRVIRTMHRKFCVQIVVVLVSEFHITSLLQRNENGAGAIKQLTATPTRLHLHSDVVPIVVA
jgi:hypothetical protein